jgi:hypothetical protein
MGQDAGDWHAPAGPMPERFEVFHLREYPKVVGLLHGLLGSQLVAEELAQETFLVAYRDWDRISRLDNPRAWVRKVAINQRGSFLRAYLRQQTREGHAVVQYEDDRIKLADDHAEVWQAIRTLPPPWDGRRAPSRPSCTTAAASWPGCWPRTPGRCGQPVAGDRLARRPAGGPWPRPASPRRAMGDPGAPRGIPGSTGATAPRASATGPGRQPAAGPGPRCRARRCRQLRAGRRQHRSRSAASTTHASTASTTVAQSTRVQAPEACLEASELADEVISRLNRNKRDSRLAVALRDYTIASQACRRAASP